MKNQNKFYKLLLGVALIAELCFFLPEVKAQIIKENKMQDTTATIKRHYGVDIDYCEGGYGKSMAFRSKNNKIVLAIWVKSRTAYQHFAHELIHTITGLFEQIGQPIKAENDEPAAYLAEYLTTQFLDKKGWKVFTNVRKH